MNPAIYVATQDRYRDAMRLLLFCEVEETRMSSSIKGSRAIRIRRDSDIVNSLPSSSEPDGLRSSNLPLVEQYRNRQVSLKPK